jgi:hypothetical protein
MLARQLFCKLGPFTSEILHPKSRGALDRLVNRVPAVSQCNCL